VTYVDSYSLYESVARIIDDAYISLQCRVESIESGTQSLIWRWQQWWINLIWLSWH